MPGVKVIHLGGKEWAMNSKDYWRVCMHTCHNDHTNQTRKPVSTRKVHIFYSGSSDKHGDLHSCDVNATCYTGVQHRRLQPLDWVKFGHSLALGRSKGRQEDIIARYIEAWRELYDAEPPMVEDNTLPKCFLDDPQYQPEGVPWFIQENSGTGTAGQDLVAGPSDPMLQPALNPTSGLALNSIGNPALDRESSLPSLIQYLKEDHFFVNMNYPNPGIKDGLHEGYADHICSAVHEKIRAVFIILPVQHPPRDYQEDSAIASVEIGRNDYDKIRQVCSKAIYKDKNQRDCKEGQVRCFMDSWLLLAIEMDELHDLFELEYLDWELFNDAVSTQSGEIWDWLCEADLIIGGVDFCGDFLEAEGRFNMTPIEMEKHWRGLEHLRQRTVIWPEPINLLGDGAKLLTYEIIRASATVLGEPFPSVVVEKEPTEQLVDEISSGIQKCVLKREFSGFSRHVFYPGKSDAVESFRALRKKEEEIFGGAQSTIFPRPRWFLQPFLPGLLYLGEYRAFFINGTLLSIVATTPIENNPAILQVQPVISSRPSDLFRLDRDLSVSDPKTTTWLTAPELSQAQVDLEKIVERFALNMLTKLIPADEFITKQRSGMRIFLRMDISVFLADGKPHFFVNELTRDHCTGLFQAWDVNFKNELLMQELAKVLHFTTIKDKKVQREGVQ